MQCNQAKRVLLATMSLVAMAMVTSGCTQARPMSPEELTRRARAILVDATNDPSPLLRSHAIEALGDCDITDAADFIMTGLNDDYWGVRFTACMALMQMKYAPAKSLLEKRLSDENASVRAAAVGALHVLGDHRRTSDLAAYLFNKDVTVRRNAAMVLGRVGEKAAVRLLKQALRDRDLSVKLQACEAMAMLGDSKALEMMLNYCRSTYDDEVILAMMALGQSRYKDAADQIAYIFERSDDSRLGMKLVAARVLAQLGDSRGRAVAMRALNCTSGRADDAARTRKLAAMALGDMPDATVVPALQPLLSDVDLDVRITAARTILKLRRNDASSLDGLTAPITGPSSAGGAAGASR